LSLDSFVAFTLIVAALYTLVFFSTVPSAYYSALTQANYLAKDTLLALATTQCPDEGDFGGTYLDLIVSRGKEPARLYAGAMIPEQFGYKIEVSDYSEGGTVEWEEIYNTAGDESPDNKHNRRYNKLKATAQSMYMVIVAERDKAASPYGYMTCEGPYSLCDLPLPNHYQIGDAELKLVRLTVFI
ncbi:MAG TPA: hypothetical protein PKJ97_00995, partial [Candidatus Bilamarchaeaceae archaeon]|nr:hypothetical protein [Candidatus Bilamarchaeaceae archaeon]